MRKFIHRVFKLTAKVLIVIIAITALTAVSLTIVVQAIV